MCPLLKVRSTLFFEQKCSSGEKVPRSWRTTITVSMFLLILLPAGIFSEGRECRWIKKERDFMFFLPFFIDFLDFSPRESQRQMEVLLPVSALKARVFQSFTPMFRPAMLIFSAMRILVNVYLSMFISATDLIYDSDIITCSLNDDHPDIFDKERNCHHHDFLRF